MVVVLIILFLFGATHSFVSHACMDELGLLVRELELELVVFTTTLGQEETTLVCVACLMVVRGHKFKVNSICFPLQGLNIISMMNWLFSNHILVD